MAKSMIHADVDSKAVLYAFKQLPKELQAEIRKHNREDSDKLAMAIRTDAHAGGVPPQAALIADSGAVVARTDRTIRVDVGGKKLVKNKASMDENGKFRKEYRANKKTGKSRLQRIGTPAGALVWGATDGSSGKPTDRSGRKMGRRFVLGHSQRGYWLQPTTEAWVETLLPKWKRRVQSAVERSRHGVS